MPAQLQQLGGMSPVGQPLPMYKPDPFLEEACCGLPPGPASSELERPGYRLMHFVNDFKNTPSGPVPRIRTDWTGADWWGTIGARATSLRNDYKIAPGLYCVGDPGPESDVLVTANYKLTFDVLRKEIGGLDLWILVLDTRGINVWCAAGKGLFGTQELLHQLRRTRLDEVVSHRRLIAPQLGATGLSAREVKKESGFSVIWGPIRARDIRTFIESGLRAETAMRRVDFPLRDRLVLTPIELSAAIKPALIAIVAAFIISGIGPNIYNFSTALSRGLFAATGMVLALVCGAILGPVLLPWLPWRAFSAKGALVGFVGWIVAVAMFGGGTGWADGLALLLFMAALSSFLTMNFTGSTPFTSPSGVEKEMRRAMPLQAGAVVLALVLWLAGGWLA